MTRRWWAFVGAAWIAIGCTEIRVVVDDRPSGGGASTTGGAAATGAGDVGGAPLGGGPLGGGPLGGFDPGPVPGCEALVLAGAPLSVPNDQLAHFLHLVALDSGDVGLVYKDQDGEVSLDVTRTTTLTQPFAAWPPIVAPIVDQHFGDYQNSPGSFSSRGNGTFALGAPVNAVFRFDQVGPTPQLSEWVDLFLARDSGGWSVDTAGELRPRDEAWVAGAPLQGFAPAPCNFRPAFATRAATALLSTSTHGACSDSEPAVARVFSLTPGLATLTVDLALPFYPDKNQLVARREGGFYLNLSTYGLGENAAAGQLIYRLDDAGVIVEQLDVPPVESPPFYNRDLAEWREGFVLTNRSTTGLGVMVGDGKHVTKSDLLDPLLLNDSGAELPMLAAPNGQSVLLAVPAIHEILIARFDCLSLE